MSYCRISEAEGGLELEVGKLKAELALTCAKMCRPGVTDIGERKVTASTTRATASTPRDSVVHPTGHHEISTTYQAWAYPGSHHQCEWRGHGHAC